MGRTTSLLIVCLTSFVICSCQTLQPSTPATKRDLKEMLERIHAMHR